MTFNTKTIVVTGGTSGIGREIVRHFAAQNHTVLFIGRNATAAAEILTEFKGLNIHYIPCNFASLTDVVKATELIKSKVESIDVLINNAGVWMMEFAETDDGIEYNFGVNHLAPMLFTLKLLPILNQQTGRIINASSGAHRRNIINLDDLEWRTQPYDGVATYSQSKLCNLLFTHKLAQVISTNTGITVNSVHPGIVKTELFNNMPQRNWDGYPTAAQGARSAIFAATASSLANKSGLYIYLEAEDPALSKLATDDELANHLWVASIAYIKSHLTEQEQLLYGMEL